MSLFKKYLKGRYLLLIFLAGYFLFALLTYQNYGNSWDEHDVYSRGQMLYEHLSGNYQQDLVQKDHNEDGNVLYNHIYGAVLYAFNKDFSYQDFHFLNLIFGSFIFIALYEILLFQYKNKYFALLGPIFLLLTPRFFGDIATNPKDIPFAIFYFLSITSIFFSSKLNNFNKIILLGILFGVTQSLRLIGFSLYMILLFFDIYEYLFSKHLSIKKFILKELLIITLIFIIATSLMILTWPYLWSDTLNRIIEIFKASSNFPWTGTILFNGIEQSREAVGIKYLPTWVAITTPILILILSFLSLRLIKNFKNKLLVLAFFTLFLNILIYLVFSPLLYDGVRHYLFILPIIVILSSITFIEFLKQNNINKKIKIVFTTVLIINALWIIKFYIQFHPYEYTYFNEIHDINNQSKNKFESDYWALSYKEAFDWLKFNYINNINKEYKIYTCGYINLLDKEVEIYLSSNMKIVALEDADFAICHSRWDEYKKLPQEKIIHTVSRGMSNFSYIYKLN